MTELSQVSSFSSNKSASSSSSNVPSSSSSFGSSASSTSRSRGKKRASSPRASSPSSATQSRFPIQNNGLGSSSHPSSHVSSHSTSHQTNRTPKRNRLSPKRPINSYGSLVHWCMARYEEEGCSESFLLQQQQQQQSKALDAGSASIRSDGTWFNASIESNGPLSDLLKELPQAIKHMLDQCTNSKKHGVICEGVSSTEGTITAADSHLTVNAPKR